MLTPRDVRGRRRRSLQCLAAYELILLVVAAPLLWSPPGPACLRGGEDADGAADGAGGGPAGGATAALTRRIKRLPFWSTCANRDVQRHFVVLYLHG